MRFTVGAADLRGALERAHKAMVTSPSLVAYTGVLIAVDHGFALLTASDGESTLTAKLKVDDAQPGSVLLRPGPLSAFLAKAPAGPVTVVGEADVDVVVKSVSGLTYRFRQLGASFPAPSFDRHNLVSVRLDRFSDALASVRHAAAGVVQFHSDEQDVTLAATDRYRICKVRIPGVGFGDFAGVVPIAGLEHLARETIDELGIDGTRRQLRARGPESFMSIRLVDEPFPDISGIVDGATRGTVTVDRRVLIESLERLSSVAGASPIRLEIDHQTLTCSATNLELGSGREAVDVSGDGDFSCLISPAFLREAAAAHLATELTLGWTGSLAPLYLRSIEGLDVTSVVMPIRS